MSVPLIKAVRDVQRYGFAVGRVRVLQTRVFHEGTYERLLDAPTFAEQMRVLSDTVYGSYLEDASSVEDVETALGRALDDFYSFLDESNLPEAVIRFFRVRYDYANLRGVLKARALGVPADELLVNLGTVPAEVVAGPVDELPEFLGDVVVELDEAKTEDGSAPDVAAIDAAVEKALFADLVRSARSAKSEALRELAALTVDIANVRTAVRGRRRGLSTAALSGLLYRGGKLKIADIEAAYALPPAEAVQALASSRALKGITVAELADPAALDVVLDNLVARFVRRVKVVPFGPEPVIAYVLAREAEVMAVRVLLIGRLAGLDREALRKRLREMYV